MYMYDAMLSMFMRISRVWYAGGELFILSTVIVVSPSGIYSHKKPQEINTAALQQNKNRNPIERGEAGLRSGLLNPPKSYITSLG